MSEWTYGRTTGGEPIDDRMIEKLADESERGYEPGQLQGLPRGRPPVGRSES